VNPPVTAPRSASSQDALYTRHVRLGKLSGDRPAREMWQPCLQANKPLALFSSQSELRKQPGRALRQLYLYSVRKTRATGAMAVTQRMPTYAISHGGGPWPWMKGSPIGDSMADLEASLQVGCHHVAPTLGLECSWMVLPHTNTHNAGLAHRKLQWCCKGHTSAF
jgi:hypothetical protein